MVQAPAGGGNAAAAAGNAGNSSRASPAVGSSSTKQSSTTLKTAPANSNGLRPTNPPQLLNAMTSAPLDLSSVERRGQPTAVREPVTKTSRPYDLPEAPTYFPTAEEFKHFGEYLGKIWQEASKYGLCKIVPPDNWVPPYKIDTKNFPFKTRKQPLNSVEGRTRASGQYVDALSMFHKQHGRVFKQPYVDKKPLEMYCLKKAVDARGGFEKVCKQKKWAEIGRDLGYSGKIMSSLSTSLKNSYQKWLCPYEDYLRVAKPGVHQQLEMEYGGPLTPSPAPSPMKRSNVNTPSSLRADSPVRQAMSALQASVLGPARNTNSDLDTPMPDASPLVTPNPPTQASSGFKPINSGAFTPVNSAFTSVNRSLAPAADPVAATPNPKQTGTPLTSAKNTPEFRPSGLEKLHPLKRQLSCDSLDSKREGSNDKDDTDGSSRRMSKRLKKEPVPTVAGSHMSMLRPSAPRIPRDETSPPGEKCEHCGKGKNEAGLFLICDSCDHGYHGACLDPPIKSTPEHEWNCARCLVGDGQYGFEEGGIYTLKQFQEKADDFKQGYFENKMPFDPVLQCHRPVTEEDVEQEFWRLVADVEETVEVEYGADIHCSTHGSGFPTMEKHPLDPYSTDPWNLNILPLNPESLFRHIKTDISGMTVPWVYVGMLFSTFCWHNEDHYAYSANYQHFGATKTWYGIPGEDAEKFEEAMREAVPELFETQPDLLFQLVTLLTPEQLKKAGVRVYALDQRAGQFVITFPQAYHAGFNHGFNFNEAVNFAPSDWEPFGLAGVERLQAFRRQPCFSHDELLWSAAEGNTNGDLSIQTAKWLAPALERIHGRELAEREAFTAKHGETQHGCHFNDGNAEECVLTFKTEDVDVPEEEYSCAYCKAFAYLSRFKCLKTGKVLCLLHAGNHACCELSEAERYLGKDHELIYRKSDEAMMSMHKMVAEKAHVPEAWEEKYAKLLDEHATPPLKTLRAMLHEGEKTPYELPSLPVLREFVERCNQWVEEATNYTVRKQQNRRKSEKPTRKSTGASANNSSQDNQKEKDGEQQPRNVDNIRRLLDEAELIGFECPEIIQLQERAEAIKEFREKAKQALSRIQTQTADSVEELLEEGQSFNIDIPEIADLSRELEKLKWNEKAQANRGVFLSITEVEELIGEGRRLQIRPYNENLIHFQDQLASGQQWEKKAQELINADTIHYPQLQALADQADSNVLPVSHETKAAVDQILHKQREAHRMIVDINERSRDFDYTKRPKYAEVMEVVKRVEELQSKPQGTLELEKDRKRHEDWMRKGKKLFGKTNAPLPILQQHMEYVLDRNLDCFDITNDRPRLPAEPASREPTPSESGGGREKVHRWEDPRFREVFCICRRVEAGMMIECELCHEWYHGKCLKIARGKVKEDDKYTCPICDWRVKIPRDAARPKLEDLIAWQDEIRFLPFQPTEEDLLAKIIDNAQEFRNHIQGYCNPMVATGNEAETQRFYLRKIEGAEIMLAYETNFFRQELHKWAPVAPEPPPVFEVSKSTRKPRPTKLQKMLAQYNVDDPEDLPENVRGKANSLKRKAQHAEFAAQIAAAHDQSTQGPGGSPGSVSYGNMHTMFSRQSSAQPQTPGLSIAGSAHAHPAHGPDSASPQDHQSTMHGRSNSTPTLKGAAGMDLDHPAFYMQDGAIGGPHLHGEQESMRNIEDGLLQGHPYLDDVGMDLHNPSKKAKYLEILKRTDVGRKRAEEIYGPDVWGHKSMDHGPSHDDPLGIGGVGHDADENDNHMFIDLVNDDEDEDHHHHGVGENKEANNATQLMADSLENERNGMDLLLGGDD